MLFENSFYSSKGLFSYKREILKLDFKIIYFYKEIKRINIILVK